MKLKVYIEEFLDDQKSQGFLMDSSVSNYRSKLDVFYEFLYEYEKVQDNTLDTMLNGLEISKIFESILFYINSRGIKSEYSVRLYTSVLSEFIKFLFSNKNIISNDNLIKSMGISNKSFNDSFSAQITDYIDKLLSEKIIVYGVSEEPISDEEYMRMVEFCDNNLYFNNIEELFTYNLRNDSYTRYVNSLMIKFILAFGFKVNILYKLDLNCINPLNNTINYKGYTVYLPNNLSNQIRNYIDIRARLAPNSNKLFIDFKGNEIRTNYAINSCIQDVNPNGTTIKVSKYIIIKMLQVGIPRVVIEEFTGNKDKILDYCQSRVYELNSLKKNVILKSKMINIDVNEYL